MEFGGALAFGAVLGWWLGGRPPTPGAAWLPLCLAGAAGAVTYLHTGAAGLAPTGAGLLVGAAAQALWRWSVRAAGARPVGEPPGSAAAHLRRRPPGPRSEETS